MGAVARCSLQVVCMLASFFQAGKRFLKMNSHVWYHTLENLKLLHLLITGRCGFCCNRFDAHVINLET